MEVQIEKKSKLFIENIKANIFSTVFLIVLGGLLVLTYYLLKDYLTVLCFSFISAIAIKPTKDYILYEIIKEQKERSKKSIFEDNQLVRLFSGIYYLAVDFNNNIIYVWRLFVDFWNSIKHFRTDIYSLLRLTMIYIMVFKMGINFSLIILGSLLLLDLLTRLIIYTYRRIFTFTENELEMKSQEQQLQEQQQQQQQQQEHYPSTPSQKKGKNRKSQKYNQSIIQNDTEDIIQQKLKAEQEADENFYNTIVSSLCVVSFVSTVVFIVISFGGLFLWDIIDMRNKVSHTLQQQLKEINQYLEREGVKSYLDESFIKDQILNQVDKLDTYINQSNLLPAIQVFQGVVNTYFNNTNSTMEEYESTYRFRLKIDECQQEYQKYINSTYIPSIIMNSAYEVTAVVCYTQIFIKQMDFNINEILNNAKNLGGNLYQNVQQIIIWIIQSLFTFLFSIIDYFLQTVIYLTSLYYLLSSPQFSLNKILLLLPLEGDIKKRLGNSLEKNIRGVFACTLKISFYHIILTWLMLDIFDLPFSFMTSILAGIIAVLPIIPVYFVTIPYCIYLYFQNCVLEMIILFVFYLHISLFSIDAIYSKNITVHPFITGICVAMGMSVFDLKGIIIGPLIVCTVYLLVDLLGQIQDLQKIEPVKKQKQQKQQASSSKKSENKQSNKQTPFSLDDVQNQANLINSQNKQRKDSQTIIQHISSIMQDIYTPKKTNEMNQSAFSKRSSRSSSKKHN